MSKIYDANKNFLDHNNIQTIKDYSSIHEDIIEMDQNDYEGFLIKEVICYKDRQNKEVKSKDAFNNYRRNIEQKDIILLMDKYLKLYIATKKIFEQILNCHLNAQTHNDIANTLIELGICDLADVAKQIKTMKAILDSFRSEQIYNQLSTEQLLEYNEMEYQFEELRSLHNNILEKFGLRRSKSGRTHRLNN